MVLETTFAVCNLCMSRVTPVSSFFSVSEKSWIREWSAFFSSACPLSRERGSSVNNFFIGFATSRGGTWREREGWTAVKRNTFECSCTVLALEIMETRAEGVYSFSAPSSFLLSFGPESRIEASMGFDMHGVQSKERRAP
ncbi:hypothetical protein KP509_32G061500 [Ceratopteris richardii]|uniref:Uncharacterized protein n=1 Tax=Ceratopteris richardii TaxID=49495 RepID=A0A8T2QVC3_CERRI|nr:hypothetical protein KP509_32G061500 [Ceratopteris richardii]